METTDLSSQVRGLPIFKNFNESEISAKVDSFRKGEKGLFWFIKLGFFIALGYAVCKYVLPVVFVAIGQMLAIAATGVFILALIIMFPVIVKGLRALTRFLHKSLIKNDPFGELAHQRDIMLENKQKFTISKGQISGLKTDCEIEANKNSEDAKKLNTDILRMTDKAVKLDKDMKAMVAKDGMAIKQTDDYVNMANTLVRTTSDATRASYSLAQAKDFIVKYGARAAQMRKFGQKLTMIETSMDIKILDFDATIVILKKDYEFAEKSKIATTAAKNAMGFSKGWELDYAIDVVTSTIATDIAITSSNLKDIDFLTKNFSIDNEDQFNNLELLAANIRGGNDTIPDVNVYKNPDYQLTSNDNLKSGSMGGIFD